jgi:cytochrome b561
MRTLRNLLLDVAIFAAFLISAEPKITGETIHEWLGLGLFVTLIAHLLIHWRWVANAVKRFFRRLPAMTRINSIVDLLIFIGFVVLTLSGVMMSKSVSTTLGFSLPRGGSWKLIHTLATDVCVYLVAFHFALHWNWFVGALRKFIGNPLKRLFQKSPELAVIPVKNDRDL